MINPTPIIACGPILSPNDVAIVFIVIGAWLLSFILVFVNLSLINVSEAGPKFKLINVAVFFVYFVTGLIVVWGGFGQSNILIIGVPAVPILSISHFVYLFLNWKRQRRLKTKNVGMNSKSAS